MKTNYKILFIYFLIVIFSSCNEKEWLEEITLDFYSPENSYNTPEQFDAAITNIYGILNQTMIESAQNGNFVYLYTTDMAYCAIGSNVVLNNYRDAVFPETELIRDLWNSFYRIVYEANVILGRIDNPEAKFNSEEQRNNIKGEAQFFRAFAYRCLGIQWGGVPLVLTEFTEPKRDFVRSSRDEVFGQCIEDLENAVQNLPDADNVPVDGRIAKAAAYHLLSEVYIIAGEYDKTIAAASAVINNPNYKLMTERFGKDKDLPGDVYWDLFRRENQNRNGIAHNTEVIWVYQYEYMVLGERIGSSLTRFLGPRYYSLVGPDGVNLFFGHSEKYGGRGIGWMASSDYVQNYIWDDAEDIRNSSYNIIRDIVADNPKSQFFGKKIVENGLIDHIVDPYNREWSVIYAKTAPLNDFPPEVVDDPVTGATNNGARYTFRDHYYMRLAETYLLRAEAYLMKGELQKAADDINIIRDRANASPVSPAEVDIDYILDERARELNWEEYRLFTLMRTGKLVERVRTFNPLYNGTMANNVIEEHHQLWPIPQSEIERNTEAALEQNPGY